MTFQGFFYTHESMYGKDKLINHKKCWSAQCQILPVTFVARTPGLIWFLSLKSHGCIFRPISSWSVYFLRDMSLSRDSSKLPRETPKPLYSTIQQPRDHTSLFLPPLPRAFCWIPSHCSRPSSNPSSSKKSFLIPSPSDLIPPCLLFPKHFVPLLF